VIFNVIFWCRYPACEKSQEQSKILRVYRLLFKIQLGYYQVKRSVVLEVQYLWRWYEKFRLLV